MGAPSTLLHIGTQSGIAKHTFLPQTATGVTAHSHTVKHSMKVPKISWAQHHVARTMIAAGIHKGNEATTCWEDYPNWRENSNKNKVISGTATGSWIVWLCQWYVHTQHPVLEIGVVGESIDLTYDSLWFMLLQGASGGLWFQENRSTEPGRCLENHQLLHPT